MFRFFVLACRKTGRALRIYGLDILDRMQASALVPIFCRPYLLRLMGIRLGRRCYINPGVRFHRTNIRFGNRCIVGKDCLFDSSGQIEIGDRVSMAARCVVHSATHQIAKNVLRMDLVQTDLLHTRIERGCWLGVGAVVLPGVTVGEGCVLAAGAVVRRNCAPNGLYAGVPASRVRDLETTTDLPIHNGTPAGHV